MSTCGNRGPKAKTLNPPTSPSPQVAVANVTTVFFGMTFAKPQNVIGPPAAATNSRVTAGAVPSSNQQQGCDERYLEQQGHVDQNSERGSYRNT